MTANDPKLEIAVIGGGIAGLTCALALQSHQRNGANIDIRIYEQAPKFGDIGAGVSMGPNAQKALSLISKEVETGFKKIAQNNDLSPDLWFDFMVGERDHPKSMQQFTTVRGQNAGTGSVHRADFLDEMVKLLDSSIPKFGHACSGYSTDDSGVTLHFDNQPDQKADVLIACDGVKSRTRRCLYERKGLDVKDQAARYSEWVAWRGLVPLEKFRETMGSECSTKQMLMGKHKHILHFPVRGGSLINIVGFVQDTDHKKLGEHTGPWAEARPKQEMLDDYHNFSPQCHKLLEAIEKPSIWGIWTCPELEVAAEDQVVLIGDAAHSMTPHQGAGAGQAVEDSLYIAALLCDLSVAASPTQSRSAQVKKALSIYSELRHPRSTKVQRTSREAGLLYEFDGLNGEGDDLDRITEALQKRMQWIWEYDVPAELERAVETLRSSSS